MRKRRTKGGMKAHLMIGDREARAKQRDKGKGESAHDLGVKAAEKELWSVKDQK